VKARHIAHRNTIGGSWAEPRTPPLRFQSEERSDREEGQIAGACQDLGKGRPAEMKHAVYLLKDDLVAMGCTHPRGLRIINLYRCLEILRNPIFNLGPDHLIKAIYPGRLPCHSDLLVSGEPSLLTGLVDKLMSGQKARVEPADQGDGVPLRLFGEYIFAAISCL
jgi:hypothetical protein